MKIIAIILVTLAFLAFHHGFTGTAATFAALILMLTIAARIDHDSSQQHTGSVHR